MSSMRKIFGKNVNKQNVVAIERLLTKLDTGDFVNRKNIAGSKNLKRYVITKGKLGLRMIVVKDTKTSPERVVAVLTRGEAYLKAVLDSLKKNYG